MEEEEIAHLRYVEVRVSQQCSSLVLSDSVAAQAFFLPDMIYLMYLCTTERWLTVFSYQSS